MNRLHCYRLWYWHDYDPETIWAWVQYRNGYMSIRNDHWDFLIDSANQDFFVMAFPLLVRHPAGDLIV
jgi:hypothetical protein